MTEADWRHRAACLDSDPDWWFPPEKPADDAPVWQVCTACPVQGECLEFALRHKGVGVWGGRWFPQRDGDGARIEKMRRREHAVQLLREGRPAKAVAREMQVAPDTVTKLRRQAIQAAFDGGHGATLSELAAAFHVTEDYVRKALRGGRP